MAQFSSGTALAPLAHAGCSPTQMPGCPGADAPEVPGGGGAGEAGGCRLLAAAKGIMECVQRAVARASAVRGDTLVTIRGGGCGCWRSGDSLWLVLPGRHEVELKYVDELRVRFGKGGWDATSTAWKNAFLMEMQSSGGER